MLAACRGLSAGFRLALLVAVAAPPAPSPAPPLTLLLALLAARLLGMGRRTRFALSLIALRVLALLLRTFLMARFLAPLLLALLLGTVTPAFPLPLRRLRLLLPLALCALLWRALFPLAARALTVAAFMTASARAVRSHRTRAIRHGRFLGGRALEPAEYLADDRGFFHRRGLGLRFLPHLSRHGNRRRLLRRDALDRGFRPWRNTAWAEPMVGCPAKGSSLRGVKMR